MKTPYLFTNWMMFEALLYIAGNMYLSFQNFGIIKRLTSVKEVIVNQIHHFHENSRYNISKCYELCTLNHDG